MEAEKTSNSEEEMKSESKQKAKLRMDLLMNITAHFLG